MSPATRTGLGQAITGALLLAGVQTLGDLVWALWIPRHQVVYGLLHGAILCACLGLVLGIFAGSRRAAFLGALGELGIGLAVSGGFYGLYVVLRRMTVSMVVCWMALWILTSLLDRRLRDKAESLGLASSRGAWRSWSGGEIDTHAPQGYAQASTRTRRNTMSIVDIQQAESDLGALLERTAGSHEPIRITSPKGNGVLLSEEDWESVQETLYLLAIPGMRESLLEGHNTPLEECFEDPGW